MPGFKDNNFLWLYKRCEPSFCSKEKDYSGFIRTRQYTVFTTDYFSNRGLFISVHSVWYIYYIGLYYTVFLDCHFLLTRVHFHDSSHQRIVVHGCAFFSFILPLKMICEPPSRCLHITAAIATESPSLKSSALFCPHSLRLYAGRLIGRGVCPCCCLFSSGMVTSPFTSKSSVTRTSRQGPLRSPPYLAAVQCFIGWTGCDRFLLHCVLWNTGQKSAIW